MSLVAPPLDVDVEDRGTDREFRSMWDRDQDYVLFGITLESLNKK